jgi:hypothetical protein
MCTVLLPPGVNPVAVNKYIIIIIIIIIFGIFTNVPYFTQWHFFNCNIKRSSNGEMVIGGQVETRRNKDAEFCILRSVDSTLHNVKPFILH